jgi:hypothetical protein
MLPPQSIPQLAKSLKVLDSSERVSHERVFYDFFN